MNVVQVTISNRVYPPTTGGDQRIHGLVTSFSEYGAEVTRYCLSGPITQMYIDKGNRSAEEEVNINDIYTEKRITSLKHDLFKLPSLFKSPGIQWEWYRLPQGVRKGLHEADIVLVEGPTLVAEVAKHTSGTVIYSSHNVETELHSKLSQSPIYRHLWKRLGQVEREAIKTADITICASDRDKQMFRSRYGEDTRYIVAPNGISITKEVSNNSSKAIEEKYDQSRPETAVFIGSNHPPNVDAVKNLFSVAEKLNGDTIRFCVAGSVCRNFKSSPDNVDLLGFIEDVDDFYSIADIGLNPMTSGGGTNIKIIEYLSRGLPVVTTEYGMRGIDINENKHAIVSDINNFPAELESLAANKDLQKTLGQNGQELVEQKYRWEKISESLYKSLCGTV